MFGFFTYPMKVGNALFRLGWTPETLPHSLDPVWGSLIRTLRSNGVSVDQAAAMLDRALLEHKDGLEFIVSKSGAYGLMFFGCSAEWDAGQFNLFDKPII